MRREAPDFVSPLLDRVLYEDAEALVIDKPAGLPVDRPRDGSDAVEMRLEELRFGFARPPSIVHRLDRDTSGCLLFARTERAHRRFAAAFEEGLVEKRYLAVVDGVPREAAGGIEMALAKRSSREQGWRMVPDARGKRAVTDWRLLGIANGRALLLLAPATGRTHQLRVHMASGLMLPIMGDPIYGAGGGTMLHAWKLTVPRRGKPVIACAAPPPPAFDAWREFVGDAG
ncbi:RluA family pseudouridine synthase [Sphingomonas sp.]|uniref:RluA family pseudouridine synthase n=1 Tax=Sphingomonas sp. TaxID=28214 RepID=UPI003B002B99